ncbi:MAG: type II toxin-antitoxin system VapC family toxin [Thermodesulfobacteriota bacterium]|nr:type II toxin-antitoxin system VapC family toxin [Thermodesulfobacteriota bacterium]
MIVVDTNILIYLWLPGDYTEQAEMLLEKDSHWVCPMLWRSEYRNVVTSFYRNGMLSYEDAVAVILNAEGQMANAEYAVNSVEVMEKVKQSTCTAYDCEYVVLAEMLETRLITNDKEILKCFPDIAVDMNDFV